MSYIEKEAFIEDIKTEITNLKLNGWKGSPIPCDELYGFIERIEAQPTADVVEVVRCKDCEYCHISTDPKTLISVQVCGYVGYNPVQSSQVTDNDYCSHGERREE